MNDNNNLNNEESNLNNVQQEVDNQIINVTTQNENLNTTIESKNDNVQLQGEEKKNKSKITIIIIVIILLATAGYFAYTKFFSNKNDIKENQTEKQKEDTEEINNTDEKEEENKEAVDKKLESKLKKNICENIEISKVIDDNSIIVEDYSGQYSIYLIVDKDGNILKDKNGKLIIDENKKDYYTFMEFKDNKLYYEISLIIDADEHTHTQIVCNYKEDDIVSKKYYREYLGNGSFGEEVFIEDYKVSNAKAKETNLEEYCKEIPEN